MANDEPQKLRVMVDANVLVAGSVWPRFPYEVLQSAVIGNYQLVLTAAIVEEARTAIMDIAPEAVQRFDKVLVASRYEEIPSPTDSEIDAHRHLIRDSKDIHVALAAIHAQVDFLITQDRDFTDRDETTEELHERINILLPGTFLRNHMGWTSEALEAIRSRTWADF